MTTDPAQRPSYTRAIQHARQALKKGDRRVARRWAERAASLAPSQEEPWLIMAALATPRASLEYLKHALDANPESVRARKGMHWAIQRYREKSRNREEAPKGTNIPISSTWRRRTTLYSWAIVLLAAIVGAAVWFGTPSFSSASNQNPNVIMLAQEWVGKATYTPTPTATFTPTPTFTLTPTPTNTPTITPSQTPSETPTPIPTATDIPPTAESSEPKPNVNLPPGVEKGDIWIDVDLTKQYLQVYKGKNLLNGFSVSTGTWNHPTVTGQYQVYVKYVAADMAGPGYYLSSVPYVMYFYEGYGIHGTYWHNNFGTPMSHGCVNLRTEDAQWVYNKSSVGTTVNIHY